MGAIRSIFAKGNTKGMVRSSDRPTKPARGDALGKISREAMQSRFFPYNEENASILCLVAEASASIFAKHWLVCSRCSWRVDRSLHHGNGRGGSSWHNPSIFRTDIRSSQDRCLLKKGETSDTVTFAGESRTNYGCVARNTKRTKRAGVAYALLLRRPLRTVWQPARPALCYLLLPSLVLVPFASCSSPQILAVFATLSRTRKSPSLVSSTI
jgi:hypothetical protein